MHVNRLLGLVKLLNRLHQKKDLQKVIGKTQTCKNFIGQTQALKSGLAYWWSIKL